MVHIPPGPIRCQPSVSTVIMAELRTMKGIHMPIRIFVVQGDKPISTLEPEINEWQQSLGPKASVTYMSTAMTEHRDELKGWQTRLSVTIWYEE